MYSLCLISLCYLFYLGGDGFILERLVKLRIFIFLRTLTSTIPQTNLFRYFIYNDRKFLYIQIEWSPKPGPTTYLTPRETVLRDHLLFKNENNITSFLRGMKNYRKDSTVSKSTIYCKNKNCTMRNNIVTLYFKLFTEDYYEMTPEILSS